MKEHWSWDAREEGAQFAQRSSTASRPDFGKTYGTPHVLTPRESNQHRSHQGVLRTYRQKLNTYCTQPKEG